MAPGGPTPAAKRLDESSFQGQAFVHAKTAFIAVKKGTVAVLAPSVHAYFWWSCIIYLTCGILLAVERSNIEAFFCSVQPQMELGGQGCPNCPGTLLMCDKDDLCYKSAMNITYQQFTKEPTMPYHHAFMQASTGLECNKIIKNARNPLDAIAEI